MPLEITKASVNDIHVSGQIFPNNHTVDSSNLYHYYYVKKVHFLATKSSQVQAL